MTALAAGVPYLDENGIEQTCGSYTGVGNSSDIYTLWNSGWYYAFNSNTTVQRIDINGNAHLILGDSGKLTVNNGIIIRSGGSLTVYGQSNGTGVLVASGGQAHNQAGINGEEAHIIINGGMVYAKGGVPGGPGIDVSGGSITINGGMVEARVSYGNGAHAGIDGTNGIVTINGGIVDTYASDRGAGIGGADSVVTISGGTVTATGGGRGIRCSTFSTGESGNAFIDVPDIMCTNDDTSAWSGVIFNGNTGRIYGSSPFTLTTDATIQQGKTLEIGAYKELIISNGVTLTNNGTISNKSSKLTNNGTITGSGKITGSGSYTGDKLTPIVTAPTAKSRLAYTGNAQALVSAGSTNGGSLQYSLEENGTYSTAIPTGVNAGDYTVWYKVVGNAYYNDVEAKSRDVTISRATPAVTAPAANDLSYTGEAQALVSGGSTTGGELQYSLSQNGEYSAGIPTGVSAGDYTVWYRVEGDGNYNSVDAAGITVTIGKAAPETPAGLTAVYGQTLADVVLPAGWRWDDSSTPVGNIGPHDFSATFIPDDPDNYETVTKDLTVTVGKDTPSLETPAGLTATYGQTLADVTLPTGWAWDDPTASVGDVGDNEFSATFTPADSDNYETVRKDLTVTVGKAAQTPPAEGAGYDISYTEETVTVISGDYELAASSTAAAGAAALNVTPGVNVYIRLKETDTCNPSGWTEVTVPARPAAPAGLQGVNTSFAGENDGRITGLAADMEYKTSAGDTWADCAGTELTGLAAGGYQVRVKATAGAFASEAVTVTVGSGAERTYTVTVNGGAGGGSYAEGDTVSITAAVPSGKRFTGWTVDEGGVTLADDGSASTAFTMPAQAVTVTANYAEIPTGGSSGGGGGGCTPPTYSPTVERPGEGGGAAAVSPSNPRQGETVTVTPRPDAGYEVDKITVTDRNGRPVEVTVKPDGTYTFQQPAGRVTVEVTYRPVQPAETPWSNPFADVTEGAWYYEAVRFVQERGLMDGYSDGRFGPNNNLSRAQLAQILFNKEGRPAVNYLMQYGDVSGGAWYSEAVRWATSQGIVSGYGNGRFGPNDPITREQLAVMLWRYSGSPAASGELRFHDADKISSFALEAVRWAVENGVISGYGSGRLDPQGLATRAQVAQMLKNFTENQQ